MRLTKHTLINRAYFAVGSGLSKEDWIKAIDNGSVNGKVFVEIGKVLIDEDDFLARDFFQSADNTPKVLDLISGQT